MNKKTSTRLKCVNAAIKEFALSGKDGAKMEAIARRAGVNKAMLYYYFTSKDNLFIEALKIILEKTYLKIMTEFDLLGGDSTDYIEQIKNLIDIQLKVFSEKAVYAKLFHIALANEPEITKSTLEALIAKDNSLKEFKDFLNEGARKGVFRKIDSNQTLISIFGLTIVIFLAKPISEVLLGRNISNEKDFNQKRKDAIIDLFLNGILV
ncbi:MAG: TetR/AcrR family transcriptional regulator [Deltaproteobacteria bacterium]|jgi:TetR/AcrR family transcriptional regulator|nr:TetR/AcrR family transcriptional regulator [Deltaproteobacteria bacterium]